MSDGTDPEVPQDPRGTAAEQATGPAPSGGTDTPDDGVAAAGPEVDEGADPAPPPDGSLAPTVVRVRTSAAPGGPTEVGGPTAVRRSWWRRFTFLGLAGATAFFVMAMTPSLLPRPPLFLGLIAGIAMAVGYALGVLVSTLLRRIDVPELPRPVKRVAWWVLAVVGPACFVVFLVLGGVWQNEVRRLVDEPEEPVVAWLAIVVAPLVAVLLLQVGRGFRVLTRFVDRTLGRFLPARLAQTVGLVLVVLVSYWIASGVVAREFFAIADSVYGSSNDGTDPGVEQPTTALRSGGPDSLVSWESLGRQGRLFTGTGPDAAAIQAFSGRPAMEPIRVYVGLDSAPDARSRAELAVRELERTGAFDRSVLVVAGATGTGWLQPQAVDSLEYLWGGDTAIATVQYSFLPSWMSFLVDQANATDASTALFDAVYATWSTLPEDHRPKLIAYGLSLGSFAAQAAFGSPGDVLARTDGALFAGTPNFTPLWESITAGRDAGSPEWEPVYREGASIRFGPTPTALAGQPGDWTTPRVAFLQHASDPVVWWDWDLITREPDWLTEPRGPDVSPATRWYPFVTFLQVTVDQFFGTTVPDGHGHNYATAFTGAWQQVVPNPDVTPAQLAELEHMMATLTGPGTS